MKAILRGEKATKKRDTLLVMKNVSTDFFALLPFSHEFWTKIKAAYILPANTHHLCRYSF